tara:strand:+ start:41 stop:562 length:522 start_codon:yes stop_codon:yes gene_type:complete
MKRDEILQSFGYEAVVPVWIAKDGTRIHNQQVFRAKTLKGICEQIFKQSKKLCSSDEDEDEIWRCPVINVSLFGKHEGFYRWYQNYCPCTNRSYHSIGKLTKLHWKFQNRGLVPKEFAEELRQKELYEIDHAFWVYSGMTSGKRHLYDIHKYQDSIPHICRPPIRKNIYNETR